jgi:hypothetical protein
VYLSELEQDIGNTEIFTDISKLYAHPSGLVRTCPNQYDYISKNKHEQGLQEGSCSQCGCGKGQVPVVTQDPAARLRARRTHTRREFAQDSSYAKPCTGMLCGWSAAQQDDIATLR